MLTNWLHGSKSSLNTRVQISVGHWTLAYKNLLMSDQGLTVVGLNAQTFLNRISFNVEKASKSQP